MKPEKTLLRIEAWDDNGNGWNEEYSLNNETEFKFDIKDNAQWVHSKNAIGMKFIVYVTYCNFDGSVKESVQLVPEVIDEVQSTDS
jgi:hypothetical protein